MFENFRISFRGIWAHKMRSFLTMLGIIIGIAAIIAIVSVVEGTQEQIKQDLIGSGNNNVKVKLNYGDSEYSSDYGGTGTKPPLLDADTKEEARAAKDVLNATFYHIRTSAVIYYGSRSMEGGTVLGVDEHYLDTLGYKIQKGRDFRKEDFMYRRKVVVLDSNAVETLFSSKNPIGKTIEISGEPYIVIGIANQSLPSVRIETIDDFYATYEETLGTVMMPNSTWPIVFAFDEPEHCIIRASNTDAMSSAGSTVAGILNTGIGVGSSKKNSDSGTRFQYKAEDLMETVRSAQQLNQSMNLLMILIAGISLLVGGIGVMNIMLVSVTERTKEIGLKKAIGARKKTILMQFLIEAAMLTSMGGILGVVSGIGLAQLISKVMDQPVVISIPAIIGSVLFSMFIGIVFGLAPSVKASNLNPIDALRSE